MICDYDRNVLINVLNCLLYNVTLIDVLNCLSYIISESEIKMFSFFNRTQPTVAPATTTSEQLMIKESSSSEDTAFNSGEPVTVASMLSGMSAPSTVELPDEEIEYLTIKDNPYAKASEPKPTGSFGVLPMRDTSDRLQV